MRSSRRLTALALVAAGALAVAGAVCRFTSLDCHLCLLTRGGCAEGAGPGSVLAAGFREEVVASGLGYSIAFACLPDNRYLFATKEGLVRVWKDGRLLDRPFLDLRDRVNDATLRGLLSIEADPEFERNGFVYLLYVRENAATAHGGTKTVVVSRVAALEDRAVERSERILLGARAAASCNDLPCGSDCIPADGEHAGGDLEFARDGTLFVSTGDGSETGQVANSLRAQDLDSLGGKVLRVSRDGHGLRDNPFWNGQRRANRSKVWSFGLRNPFRMTVGPAGVVVGDVGWNTAEEIDVARRGANLGWPCYEGRARVELYVRTPVCRALYRRGDAELPVFEYATTSHPARASVTGGAFLSAPELPPAYQGAYVYGDWSRDWLRYLKLAPDAGRVLGSRHVASHAGRPVEIEAGPDHALYYLASDAGELRKITYSP